MKASALFVRVSPKKIAPIAREVQGLPARQALDRLQLFGTPRAKLLASVIHSAVSNATHNGRMDISTLHVASITVGKGPHFTRFRAVSRGMAHTIQRRMSHISVVLEKKHTKVLSEKTDRGGGRKE